MALILKEISRETDDFVDVRSPTSALGGHQPMIGD